MTNIVSNQLNGWLHNVIIKPKNIKKALKGIVNVSLNGSLKGETGWRGSWDKKSSIVEKTLRFICKIRKLEIVVRTQFLCSVIYMQSGALCGAWWKIVPFLCFINIFFVFQWLKKNQRTFFSLKIKSSEKQKFVYKLFQSKSKIL